MENILQRRINISEVTWMPLSSDAGKTNFSPISCETVFVQKFISVFPLSPFSFCKILDYETS